jgi:hypothetical protein
MYKEPPILEAIDTGENYAVWCKYCNRWHYHSRIDGHRVAHCFNLSSPYKETGYEVCLTPLKEMTVKQLVAFFMSNKISIRNWTYSAIVRLPPDSPIYFALLEKYDKMKNKDYDIKFTSYEIVELIKTCRKKDLVKILTKNLDTQHLYGEVSKAS